MQESLDDGHKPPCHVVHGELLVAGRQGAALLVPADHLLNPAATPVRRPIESRLPRLVRPRGDHRTDVATLEPSADARIAVALVGPDPPGPARPPRLAGPLRPEQDDAECLRLVALAGGHPDRQHDAVAVA